MRRVIRSRKKTALLLCLATLLSLPITSIPATPQQQKATTAEEYKKYVDQAIPLSRSYAKHYSQLSEYGLFWNQMSMAQSHLSRASDATIVFNHLIQFIQPLKELTRSDRSADAESLLEQALISDQMSNAVITVHENLESYRKIADGVPAACDKSFDDYDVERIFAQFRKPDIETFDGVYVELGNVIVAITTFAKSVWQVMTNTSEQREIEKEAARLERDRTKTLEFRNLAVQMCRDNVSAFKKRFDQYTPIATALEEWVKVASIEHLKTRAQIVTGKYSAEFTESIKNAARVRVQEKLRAKNDADKLLIMSSRANLRIGKNIGLLSSSSCSDATVTTQSLESDIALASVYSLESTLTLVPRVKKAIKAKQEKCAPRPVTTQAHHLTAAVTVVTSKSSVNVFTPVKGCVIGGGYAFSPFCDYLQQHESNSSSNYGVFTSETGQACGYSSRSSIGTYSFTLCGMPLNAYGGIAPDVWAGARTIIATANQFPWQYNTARGARNGSELEKSLQNLREKNSQFEQILNDLMAGQETYFANTVPASVKSSVDDLSKLRHDVRDKLLPIMSAEASSFASPPGRQLPAPTTEFASDQFQPFLTSIELDKKNGNTKRVWERLMSLSDVRNSRLDELPLVDRQILRDVYERYFNDKGILKDEFLGKWYDDNSRTHFKELSNAISLNLGTDAHTSSGYSIRHNINRGLLAAAISNNPSLIEHEYGALGLFLGADFAFSNGDPNSGERLLAFGAKMTDFVLGFVPLASTINDSVQIIYGMATGYDYTGERMAAADYALRGIGVVLGVSPAGSKIVRLGGQALGEAFKRGATIVRDFGQGRRFVRATRGNAPVAKSFIEIIGDLYRDEKVVPDLTKRLKEVSDTIDSEIRLADSPSKGILGALVDARETGNIVEEGGYKLFSPVSRIVNDVPSDGLYARVMPKETYDQLISGHHLLRNVQDRLLLDPRRMQYNEAFITAAEDLKEFTGSAEVAKRLGLYDDPKGNTLRNIKDWVIVEFRFNGDDILRSPVNFDATDPRKFGWISGGTTVGGAREWIIDVDAFKKGLISIDTSIPPRIVGP